MDKIFHEIENGGGNVEQMLSTDLWLIDWLNEYTILKQIKIHKISKLNNELKVIVP